MNGISIIIPTYNRENFIAESIQSVLNQQYDGTIELILSDDGSSDKTLEIAKSFGNGLTILRKPKDCFSQGASSARNRGIKASTQPYICFLDSDDYYLPGHLNKISSLLESNQNLGFAFCRVLEKIEQKNIELFKPWTKKNITTKNILYPVISGNNIVCTNSFIFRREIFNKVGVFNESYSNGEDADMWLRIIEKYKGGFSDHFGAVRRKHGQNQLTFNLEKKIRQDHFMVYSNAIKRCHESDKKDFYCIYKLQSKILKYRVYRLISINYFHQLYSSLKHFTENLKLNHRKDQVKNSNIWNELVHFYKSSDADTRFVINTATFWDEPPRARHQVAQSLAKRFKVIFVAANKVGIPRIELKKDQDNILILQPYFPVDFRIRYRLPIINEIYQYWLYRRLKEIVGEVEIINFDFTAYLIHKYFKNVYYYCNDNFTSISKKLNLWFIFKYHGFCERKLAGKAKLCIGTSSIIVANLLKINNKSYEILLGGPNIDEFNIEPSQKKITNETINIGLVGFIRNYNLSSQLINDILQQIDCTITLIGPVEPNFLNNINDQSRVRVKGIRTDIELLKEVNEFDVAIAPYLDRKIEEGGMPNKLFIYLALGKPVVMTELLSLKQMDLPEKMVYLVKNSNEFPKLITKAQEENNWDLIQQRIRYAKENTWDCRISQFLSLLSINS